MTTSKKPRLTKAVYKPNSPSEKKKATERKAPKVNKYFSKPKSAKVSSKSTTTKKKARVVSKGTTLSKGSSKLKDIVKSGKGRNYGGMSPPEGMTKAETREWVKKNKRVVF